MQIIGLGILLFVVWFGFEERTAGQISAFDLHALVIVLAGSAGAILICSSKATALRTLTCLKELIPSLGKHDFQTQQIEKQRQQVIELWVSGEKAKALNIGENSAFASIMKMIQLAVGGAPRAATSSAFLELRHRELSQWQPAVSNWELLSKLAPSFGMVGTITGMIQLFKNMGADDLNIGSAMSLALLATLYGVAFGAGVAGPIGHYLRGLLDERLGVLERCEQGVEEMLARSDADLTARRA
jgi:flagellar motor component MotA